MDKIYKALEKWFQARPNDVQQLLIDQARNQECFLVVEELMKHERRAHGELVAALKEWNEELSKREP